MSAHPGISDSHLRSLLKAISWRCVGTMDTFLVSFVVLSATGAASGGLGHAARISGGIAGVEVLTKVFLYYVHERAWGKIRIGRRGAALAPATAVRE
ncbi:MAG: DUF2061 domain-containing protein [Verrucomicrobiota bacterium]